MVKRTVYFVSESTGITAEALGQSLLSQFAQTVQFRRVYMPFINSIEKADELVAQFNRLEQEEGYRPIVFATMADPDVREILHASNCLYIELFDSFIGPLSRELHAEPSGQHGLSHGMTNGQSYEDRMSIINFAVVNDDGARLDKFDQADVILIGVSRSGKTPTCLYLAIHFEIKAANYPLTEEDFEKDKLPDVLIRNKEKLMALTIDPARLNRIREERRRGSRYASIARCHAEVSQALRMFKRLNLKVLDTTTHSIEEVSSRIAKVIRSEKALKQTISSDEDD
ncbi:pyruvate, water dikinase regulatory protein [Candidatus Vondammii sp. HM_W22]|uniref:pyruvate, water dikinase regulatory protein n=1 Tax=Candidatus Vondammii sp. HM_W22 TaxID=2687299 RepID=UPI001F12F5AE|nr:pyruvate, water dikinase regulatory protein [Candidatus Vondammii sp. HM_W22]